MLRIPIYVKNFPPNMLRRGILTQIINYEEDFLNNKVDFLIISSKHS
jgi:hypothetical protein